MAHYLFSASAIRKPYEIICKIYSQIIKNSQIWLPLCVAPGAWCSVFSSPSLRHWFLIIIFFRAFLSFEYDLYRSWFFENCVSLKKWKIFVRRFITTSTWPRKSWRSAKTGYGVRKYWFYARYPNDNSPCNILWDWYNLRH